MKSFLTLLLLLVIITAHGQQQADMQKLRAQMAHAQHMIDSLRKKNPGMVLPNMPASLNLNKGQQVGDSLRQSANTRLAALENYQGQIHQQSTQSLPKGNASRKVTQLAVFDDRAVVNLAKQMLPHIIYGLDSTDLLLRGGLDKVIKDSTVNVAGTGVLLMTMSISRYSGEYLICKDVIANPTNVWSLNDLGVALRNEVRYKDAIQVFTYACSLDNSLYVIQANLGWACAYYGDFDQAKIWFNKALNNNQQFNSAMEGLATIAYQQGDLQALFTCLANEVKTVGGGGPGPSQEFANLCGEVNNNNDMSALAEVAQGEQSAPQADPSSNHTYDNPNGAAGNQDLGPNGQDTIDYPHMRNMFANSYDNLIAILPKTAAFYAAIKKASADSRAAMTAKTAALTYLNPTPQYDAAGNKRGTYNYTRFYTMFHQVHQQFEERAAFIFKTYSGKIYPLLNSISAHNIDLIKRYTQQFYACTNDECTHEVNCTFKPIFCGSLATDFAAVSELWTSTFSDLQDVINWYTDASSPFIRRVRQDDWNKYMNAIREDDVRQAVLSMYNRWAEAQAGAGAAQTGRLVKVLEDVVCTTPLREIEATGPDPSTVKLKKLKTAADYCDPKEAGFDVNLIFAAGSGDCSGWKVSFGGDDHNLFLSQTYGKHKEDDKFRAGASIGVGMEHEIGAGGASLKAGVKAQVDLGWQFGSTGNVEGQFADAQISAGVTGAASTGNDAADALIGGGLSTTYGVSAKVSIMVSQGANGNNVTTVTGSTTAFGKQ